MPQNSPIFAAVDLGSNSFHLLVARVDNGPIVYIDREKDNVRLAEGLLSDGTLEEKVQLRAIEVLKRFRNLLDAINPIQVRAVGTNTLRAAKNSGSFLKRAEEALGYPIEIISGREEARLIYLGLAKDFTPDTENRLVIDIGGGSTEVIVGNREPEKMESLYMGCVSYSRRFFPHGRITKNAYKQAVLAARQEIQGIAGQYANAWHHAVGSSGTIRTVLKIIKSESSTPGIIKFEDMEKLSSRVIEQGDIEALNFSGLKLSRRPVFPGGLAILHALFLELRIQEMHVSNYTMKEGILYELVGRSHHMDKRDETVKYLIDQYNIDQSHAKRVENQSLQLLKDYQGNISLKNKQAKLLLRWASQLHETGLAIAHSGFQKHGAYIIENADLPGFNRLEQHWISFLILNHRRRLKTAEERYGFQPDWGLLLIFRLACLIQRRRTDMAMPDLTIEFDGKQCCIGLSSEWRDKHPVIMQSLQAEIDYWAQINIVFKIEIDSEKLAAQKLRNKPLSNENEEKEADMSSELSGIKKLKKKGRKKLARRKITAVEDVAKLKKKKLAKILDIKKKKAGKIIKSAQKLTPSSALPAEEVTEVLDEKANEESQIVGSTNESSTTEQTTTTNIDSSTEKGIASEQTEPTNVAVIQEAKPAT